MRIAERDAHVNAVRAEHEAARRTDDQTAARHRQLARIWRALEAKAARGGGHVRRRPGHPAAMGSRHRSHPPDRHRRRHRTTPPPPRYADRRRSARTPAKPTASAYPRSPGPSREATPGSSSPSTDGTVLADGHRPARPEQDERSASDQREAAGQLALGLTPRDRRRPDPRARYCGSAQNASIAQAKLDELARTPLPGARKTTSHQGSPGRHRRAGTRRRAPAAATRRRPLRPRPEATTPPSRRRATARQSEADE